MKIEDNCLLDTSALFTYTDNEKGADVMEDLLHSALKGKILVFLSSMSLMELYYVTHQEMGEEAARQLVLLVRSLPVKELALSEDLILPAGDFKARYRISVANAWIAATAKVYHLNLVHKDPEFEPLKEELTLTELPYKSGAR